MNDIFFGVLNHNIIVNLHDVSQCIKVIGCIKMTFISVIVLSDNDAKEWWDFKLLQQEKYIVENPNIYICLCSGIYINGEF